MPGLNKEIWLPDIIEQFIPQTSFVNEARDLDAWTDNGFLNLQEAGVNPDVIVNNSVWPIPIVRREDIPELARHAAHECNPLYPVPVEMDAKELEKIYELVLEEQDE